MLAGGRGLMGSVARDKMLDAPVIKIRSWLVPIKYAEYPLPACCHTHPYLRPACPYLDNRDCLFWSDENMKCVVPHKYVFFPLDPSVRVYQGSRFRCHIVIWCESRLFTPIRGIFLFSWSMGVRGWGGRGRHQKKNCWFFLTYPSSFFNAVAWDFNGNDLFWMDKKGTSELGWFNFFL